MASKKAAPPADKKKGRLVPKEQHLPTMEDIEIPELSKTCAAIAEAQSDLNSLSNHLDGLKANGLHQLQKHGRTHYKRHGVELVHVHTDKLRVRLVDDDSGEGKE